jgi:hypothetical protein
MELDHYVCVYTFPFCLFSGTSCFEPTTTVLWYMSPLLYCTLTVLWYKPLFTLYYGTKSCSLLYYGTKSCSKSCSLLYYGTAGAKKLCYAYYGTHSFEHMVHNYVLSINLTDTQQANRLVYGKTHQPT